MCEATLRFLLGNHLDVVYSLSNSLQTPGPNPKVISLPAT
jgi:hypothetical protein